MPIEAGQQLLHYRLREKLGEGGMGVVWRAIDTSLDRAVAIKVLPDDFSADRDRRIRFEREAKILATLDHRNIAAVYGLHAAPIDEQQQRSVRFIAMELVEGTTLAERLGGPPLPLEDTLDIIRQIAEALEAAHDRGIVHRDLKPANVMVRRDGTVKVLDFGLARAVFGEQAAASDPDAPTATAETRSGMLLGTAPYMSPEQVRGRPVDKRADIWALGCVVYECLTSRRPFQGDSTSEVMASIVSHEPDYAALPRATPDFLRRLLPRCLHKESRNRLRDAGELRIAIEEYQSPPESQRTEPTVMRSRARLSLATLLPWILVVLLASLLAWTLSSGTRRSAGGGTGVSRWSIGLPPGSRVALPKPGGGFDHSRTVAISRDGSKIAFSVESADGTAQLYLKPGAHLPPARPSSRRGHRVRAAVSCEHTATAVHRHLRIRSGQRSSAL